MEWVIAGFGFVLACVLMTLIGVLFRLGRMEEDVALFRAWIEAKESLPHAKITLGPNGRLIVKNRDDNER